MSLSDRFLSPSETLQLRTGPHPVVMNPLLAAAAGVLALSLLSAYGALRETGNAAKLLVGLALVFMSTSTVIVVKALLRRASRVVMVTDQRVVEVRGVISYSVRDVRLDALQSVRLDQSIFGRIFNFGTVTLETGNDDPMVLEDIAFPLELQQALQDVRVSSEYELRMAK